MNDQNRNTFQTFIAFSVKRGGRSKGKALSVSSPEQQSRLDDILSNNNNDRKTEKV